VRILIVDDLPANQRLMSRVVARLGHESDVAGSGAVALAMLAEAAYDVVFMDVQMPVMDGLETTRRIRAERSRSVRIIALSGFAEDDWLDACREAGMDGYVAKPLTIPAIAAALEDVAGAASRGAVS
jgi:CheY-like chemotaxis protein